MGPGKVLAGLNKRIDSRLQTVSIFDIATFEAALATWESAREEE
jgi:hypothetical protein